MTGQIDLQQIQVGKENTWGSTAAATAKMMDVLDIKIDGGVKSKILRTRTGGLGSGHIPVIESVDPKATYKGLQTYEDLHWLEGLLGIASPGGVVHGTEFLPGTGWTSTDWTGTTPSGGFTHPCGTIETYTFTGGGGYSIGDVLTAVFAGASGATFRVDSVAPVTGVILTMTQITKGTKYEVGGPLVTTVSPGGGTLATITVLTINNTSALSQSSLATVGTEYTIVATVSGLTAGMFTLAFGGNSHAGISTTTTWTETASAAAGLTITPTATFDGKIILSIRANSYTRAYTNPDAAIVTPRMQTLYYGNASDGVYKLMGAIPAKMAWAFENNKETEFSVDILAKSSATGALAALSDRVVTPVMGNDVALYIDDWAGTIGATVIPAVAFAADLEIDTKRVGRSFLGALTPGNYSQPAWEGTLKIRMEFDATYAKTYYEAMLAAASVFQKQVRLKATNGVQVLQFDFAGTAEEMPTLFDERDGVQAIEFVLKHQYNPSLTAWLKVASTNLVAVLP